MNEVEKIQETINDATALASAVVELTNTLVRMSANATNRETLEIAESIKANDDERNQLRIFLEMHVDQIQSLADNIMRQINYVAIERREVLIISPADSTEIGV